MNENEAPNTEEHGDQQILPQTPTLEIRRSSRTRKPIQRYSLALHYLLLTDGSESECYEEALEVDFQNEWEHKMDEEMKSLISNQTSDLVLLPDGKKVLSNK